MKNVAVLSVLLISAMVYGQVARTSAPSDQKSTAPSQSQAASGHEFVTRYCAACHNDKLRSGGFTFTQIDLAHPGQNADQAEKVILKLRTGMMPPAGMPRPQADVLNTFVSDLETRLDRAAADRPNSGTPALHRMNRAEYRNSIRDLLGLDVDVETLLPADNITHGFDNMSEALTVTPTLMEAYVRAAGKISRLAVGDPTMLPIVDTYRVATNFSQIRHVEGTPFGTRGGISVVHNFPADAEYVFRMTLVFTRNTFLFGSTMDGEQLEVSVNGERAALLDINPLMKTGDNDLRTPPIKVKAGPQTISASFIKKGDGPIDDILQRPERSLADDFSGQIPGLTNPPHLRDLGIMGPYKATGVSETVSRRRIFTCRPTALNQEEPCAKEIISRLARQAYRRPVSKESLEDLMHVYGEGRDYGNFDSGIRMALQFVLANPEFIYRFERTPPGVRPGDGYRVSDLELASRLSFFLWSSLPDEELIAVASQGKLRDPAVLQRQVKRLLADPRSEALAKNFATQWLHLRGLTDANPDVYLYPDSDDNLLQSMRRETELLFDSIARDDRNVVDLLTANYTFVDERLAKHYGIPNVLGNRFRRVTLTDENRFGLLGQGSVLTVTSVSNRTSPVARGKWVLEQLLGVNAPVPPPNVPALEENNVIGGETIKLRSVRERMEQHRAKEPCASCHKIMDPIGLALENFDPVGAWRTRDSGFLVDASGKLVDGTKVDSPASLRLALLHYSDAYITNFTNRLLTYALGRGLSASDMPTVRKIIHNAGDDHRFGSIVLNIVRSEPFQMRRADPQSAEKEVALIQRSEPVIAREKQRVVASQNKSAQ
jgi:mono/diheme cytochrome c family protein